MGDRAWRWLKFGALACALPGLGGCAIHHYRVGGRGTADAPPPRAAAQPADMPSFAYAPLTPMALSEHIQILASDAYEGRSPASAGEARTLDYIARAFTAAGLEPGATLPDGRRGWLQNVPIAISRFSAPPELNVRLADGEAVLRDGDNILIWSERAEPELNLNRAELVFAGYGISAPERGWDDYEGVDVSGRVVMILANDPDFTAGENLGFQGRALSPAGTIRAKLDEAARRGAAGILLIHETGAAGFGWDSARADYNGTHVSLLGEDGGTRGPLFEGWINAQSAEALLARAGPDLAVLRGLAQTRGFRAMPLNAAFSATLPRERETRMTHNVIGVLPGRSHARDAVIYGAHWSGLGGAQDQCAPINGDAICNGALDNASGIAGLIELARRFSHEPRTERSVAFVAFAGEERNQLGSVYYVDHPAFPLARTAAMIDVHMLSTAGPSRDIVSLGPGGDLQTMLAEAAQSQGRSVSAERNPVRGAYYFADAFSFARTGAPSLSTRAGLDLYAGGEERGLALRQVYMSQRHHRPGDEYDSSWDLTGALRDLLLLHDVGRRVAESAQWPNWDANSEYRALRDAQARRR